MERLLFFVCTICALIFTVHLTTSVKLSLRQGPQKPETANPIKNCTMCPRLFKPICASNGNWYHNPCFMACEVGDNSFVGILYEGVCRPEHSSTKHINITRPTTDRTMTGSEPHKSETANPDKIAMTGLKNCTMCPRLFRPICASNGNWYHNPCFMACEVGDNSSVHILYEGVCRPEHSSTKHINITRPTTDRTMPGCGVCDETTRQPLCGTDGKTYLNECLMNCTVNRNVVKVAYLGNCVVNTPAFSNYDHYIANCTVCPKIYDPVCMTNGEWYYNTCVMYCALGNDTDVRIRYQGKCIHFWRKSEDTTKRS